MRLRHLTKSMLVSASCKGKIKRLAGKTERLPDFIRFWTGSIFLLSCSNHCPPPSHPHIQIWNHFVPKRWHWPWKPISRPPNGERRHLRPSSYRHWTHSQLRPRLSRMLGLSNVSVRKTRTTGANKPESANPIQLTEAVLSTAVGTVPPWNRTQWHQPYFSLLKCK